MLFIAMPSTYRSPSRMSGRIAERADSNGGASRAETNSRISRSGNGTPGTASSATSTIRPRSQRIIVRRRGSRSAIVARIGPPAIHGR